LLDHGAAVHGLYHLATVSRIGAQWLTEHSHRCQQGEQHSKTQKRQLAPYILVFAGQLFKHRLSGSMVLLGCLFALYRHFAKLTG